MILLLLASLTSLLHGAEVRLNDLPLPTDYCKNGGALINGECQCTLRYEGKQCERERCLNGGKRHGTNGKVKCHCPFGLSGERCEKVNYCEEGKGKLVNGKCECFERWTGLFCQIRTCYNGVPTGGLEVFCMCDIGYTGPFCDMELVCENGGTVNQDNECSCRPGFHGEHCEECALGHHREGNDCVPEIQEHPLLGASTADQFAWPVMIVGVAALLAVILIAVSATFALRKWKTKPSRVSSVQGEREGTDV